MDLHFDSGPDTACLANCCFGDFCSRWPPSSNTGRVFTTRIGVTGRHRRFIHSPRTKRRPHREVSDVKLKQCRPARWWKAPSDFSTGCCLPSAPVCWSSGFTASVLVGTFLGFCQMNRRMWSNSRPGCALYRPFRSCDRYVRAIACGALVIGVSLQRLRLKRRASCTSQHTFELRQMQPVVF